MKKKNLRIQSRLVHGGEFENPLGSAVVSVYQTSTFIFGDADLDVHCFQEKMMDTSMPGLGIPPSMHCKPLLMV